MDCQSLVIDQSFNLSPQQRSKSDSEIYFHSSKLLLKTTSRNYGTLKVKKSLSMLETSAQHEYHRKKCRNNTLPKCHINYKRIKRAHSLPSTIKLLSYATNETRQNNNTTEIAPINCGVDHLFVFNVVLAQQQQNAIDMNRPRQYGRRSNNTSRNDSSTNDSRLNDDFLEFSHISQSNNESIITQTTSEMLDSMFNENVNSSPPPPVESNNRNHNSSFLSQSPRLEAIFRDFGPRFCVNEHDNSDDGWPISISRPVTCSFCCIGLFNFTRFSISTIIYGGNFLIQFVILSIFFGIPFVLLQMLLGQKIKRGIVTMFKISPVCKGIGISLLISHCVFCLYSSVSIGWMMIYLRNFLTPSTYNAISINVGRNNDSNNIFNYEVPNKNFRFQFALFCCLIWTSTFIALCKGKKSLSIVTLVITIFSYVGIFLLNLRFLIFLNFKPITELFSNTNFREFFANSNCWYNAAQETFFTWGLLGVSILSIYKRKSTDDNNNNESNGISFKREIILIISLTFFGLFLSAILGSICLMNIKTNGLTTISIAGNFTSKYHFTSIDEEWINRYNSIIGEVSIRGDFVYKKMLRLVTEFMPWTLAILISEPVWGILFFVSLIFLGLSQNAVMWRPISTLIGNSTSTVLLSCGSALLLMFPLTTDEGQNIVQYLDFIFGGAWWVNLMWAFYLISIFIVRGSPYTSDTLVQNLKFNSFISAFIAFSWTFTIPTGLIILTVLNYKRSFSKILFKSNYSDITMSYWPQWTLRLGGFFQISMLCIVPLIAIYELYYHLTKGPRDILERVELLFRPPVDEPLENFPSHLPLRRLCTHHRDEENSLPEPVTNNQWIVEERVNDQPPNYSPPPSYSKAIGARIANTLRNSFRRSMRSMKKMRKSTIEQQQQNNTEISSSSPPYETFETSASVSSIQTIFNNNENNLDS